MGSAEVDMQNLNIQRATRQISALSLAVVIVLYLAHALPLYFYNVALPAILRHQGVDLRWIGMLSLLIFHGRLSSYGRHSSTGFISKS